MTTWNSDNPAKVWMQKDKDAVLDYPIDYKDWLDDIQDNYASHTVVNVSGIVIDSSSYTVTASAGGVAVTGKYVVVWCSGGTVGETAQFTIRIVTAGGRTDDRTFYLKITDGKSN